MEESCQSVVRVNCVLCCIISGKLLNLIPSPGIDPNHHYPTVIPNCSSSITILLIQYVPSPMSHNRHRLADDQHIVHQLTSNLRLLRLLCWLFIFCPTIISTAMAQMYNNAVLDLTRHETPDPFITYANNYFYLVRSSYSPPPNRKFKPPY